AVPTIFPWGTLPYVEPTPHAVIENEQSLANIADEKEGEINQQLMDQIVKIKSELKATIGVKSPSKRSASVDEPGTSEPKKKSIRVSLDSKKLPPANLDPFAKFAPGTRIEAQDFNEVWHAAKVMEVDSDEKEVLINFEKSTKSKTPAMVTEWIPMNSSRLRPLQVVKKPIATYVPGEKVLARWTDSRKFPATIQKVLEN
ncbi:PHD finger protein 20-like protein 1, partial [Pseudolycoriella hygida]